MINTGVCRLVVIGIAMAAARNIGRGDEAVKPAGAETGVLTVVDGAGKEHRLTSWKFTVGTTRLSWLAPAPKKVDEDKGNDPKNPAAPAAPTGPEALVLREESSTDLKEGIFTYIPVVRIKSIEYDNEKRAVSVTAAVPGQKGNNEQILMGSTKYVGENKLTIEAEADLGDLGVAAVKFQGGTAKGIKSIRFPPPKVEAGSAGCLAEITIAGKGKDVHKVSDLAPLYQLGSGVERLIPILLFKKTVKIDLAKIQTLTLSENGGLEFDVALKDGKNLVLTLLEKVSPVDAKPAQLRGFIARVPAGYKFYPVKPSPNNAFTVIQFDPDKVEKNKDDKKTGDNKSKD